MLDKEQRLKIKNLLPHGYIKKIANVAGVSVQSASNWFRGKYNSERFEDAVFKVLKQYTEVQEEKIREIFSK